MNSGMFHVPDSHPTPSASLSGFGVLLCFFLGLVGLSSSSSLEALLAFVAASMHVMLA